MGGTDSERWKQIGELYHQALEQEGGGRSELLANAAPDLRREVESLLAQDSGDGLLHYSAWDQALPPAVSGDEKPLAPGAQVGRFTIESLIGEGGMGKVYRASDSVLGRSVAIKVTKAQFSARFAHEARAISSLNHSTICTLYDVGPNYLVMEFVEGPTLAARLKKGPMPLEAAWKVALQIAAALEAAHQKGIVHRDLKPGNIHIKPDGTVKILDFGLAKFSDRIGETGDSAVPEQNPTNEKAIVGTPAYMSPEQAAGMPVDERTDIWAFGVVLYEMLTGKRPFAGTTTAETLANLAKDQPDWNAVPRQVRRLLQSCLEKDPQRRLRDIGDAWRLLDDAPESAALARSRAPWVLASILGLAAGVLAAWLWRTSRPSEKPLLRLDVELGSRVALDQFASISPDGSRLVYMSNGKLYTLRLDQAESTELVNTDGVLSPFFSPDGKWVAYFVSGNLMKVSVDSGAPVKLCDADSVNVGGAGGGSWGDDGSIIASLGPSGGLFRIPSTGGVPKPVTTLDRDRAEVTHRWPSMLPGSRSALFTSHTRLLGGFDEADIDVVNLRDGSRKTLVKGGMHARYLPTGHIVFLRRGTLFAAPFDVDRLELRAPPRPVLTKVAYIASNGDAFFDFSRAGTLIYQSGEATPQHSGQVVVEWLSESGTMRPLLPRPGHYSRPRLSPDGRRLAMRIGDASGIDLWTYDIDRDAMTRLTAGGTTPDTPVWTPDGRFVIFSDPQAGGMYWTRADGGSKPAALTGSKNPQQPYSLTPDGRRLAFMQAGAGGFDLWTVPIRNDGVTLEAGPPEPFLRTPFDERHDSFSPDGRWLAYSSNETGTFEIYVRAFPDNGTKLRISNAGGVNPLWSRSGHKLFYRTEEEQIMVVSYTADSGTFQASRARQWSTEKPANVSGRAGANFDVAADGRSLAILIDPDGAAPTQHHAVFIENFFDEVRRQMRP